MTQGQNQAPPTSGLAENTLPPAYGLSVCGKSEVRDPDSGLGVAMEAFCPPQPI